MGVLTGNEICRRKTRDNNQFGLQKYKNQFYFPRVVVVARFCCGLHNATRITISMGGTNERAYLTWRWCCIIGTIPPARAAVDWMACTLTGATRNHINNLLFIIKTSEMEISGGEEKCDRQHAYLLQIATSTSRDKKIQSDTEIFIPSSIYSFILFACQHNSKAGN